MNCEFRNQILYRYTAQTQAWYLLYSNKFSLKLSSSYAQELYNNKFSVSYRVYLLVSSKVKIKGSNYNCSKSITLCGIRYKNHSEYSTHTDKMSNTDADKVPFHHSLTDNCKKNIVCLLYRFYHIKFHCSKVPVNKIANIVHYEVNSKTNKCIKQVPSLIIPNCFSNTSSVKDKDSEYEALEDEDELLESEADDSTADLSETITDISANFTNWVGVNKYIETNNKRNRSLEDKLNISPNPKKPRAIIEMLPTMADVVKVPI